MILIGSPTGLPERTENMANNCFYTMRIVGKKENCQKWFKKMKDYEEENHFHRIFNAYIDDEEEDYMEISGDCAWSVESCCRAYGYSNGIDLLSVNSRELELDVEIYSQESGMAFEEHYLYKKGECLVNECVPWCEYYVDPEEFPTLEDYNREYGTNLTEEDKVSDVIYETGGFENYGEWRI